ncbi:acetylajmalan esterase-like isoform X1 [Syzygium oleosum]|uniref:acetylajmalan esterase-like isoform X1 n=1 Tax=Syzygium oleosum TaxID=219896 RepID=UPI0011D1CE81|nr:acetylajmalan esterase-like isoform X1 [Syzygium oleosum]
MPSKIPLHFLLLTITSFLCFSTGRVHGEAARPCPINAIYQFGDSTSDTGNLIRMVGPNDTGSQAARLPYGETLGKPTGRFSDGRLIVDYFAMALGLPLVNPYLGKNLSFEHGVNFAVAGSTVLNSSFYAARNVTVPASDVPLRLQLNWFRNHLNSTCGSQIECGKKLKRSLVIVGEMGSNDFLYSFLYGKSILEVLTYVPPLVEETINVTRELIKLGASKVVVFGDFAIGCSPIYLSIFKSNDSNAYDDKGCLKAYNAFSQFRNIYVQVALAKLRQEFPRATILYGDYYNGYKYVLDRASHLGFDPQSALKACCGTGGSYNYNFTQTCGSTGVTACPNPNEFISWDGVHLTQEAHRRITEYNINKIFPELSCAT